MTDQSSVICLVDSPELFSEPVSEADLKTMIDAGLETGLEPFDGQGKHNLYDMLYS